MAGLRANDADFSFANLVAARFAPRGRPGRAVLRNARFTGARLQGACLNGADLRDAHFEGANLRGATFHDVTERDGKINDATCRSILRCHARTWRHARWDPETWRRLKELDWQGPTRTAQHRRKPSDIPPPNYRRHPYPHHEDHQRRSRVLG